MPLELDCPALDMNDVLYCPYDENFVVAGCTNGKTYVWDIRQHRPEEHLYSLAHGKPLMELGDDDPASRERLDTGIRFCSWGYGRRQLYTGSSDGVLKEWDLYRAPEDVFSKDIVQLNSGIMSGAFSPDYTSLLLGEVNGTINTMEVGKSDRSIRDTEPFDFFGSSEPLIPSEESSQCDDDDSGIAAAKHLLETDQMILRPMGSVPIRQAVQGPEYKGPWDNAGDAQALRKAAVRFQDSFSSLPTVTCELPGCRDAASKLVPEEAGDSGRSSDRIPDALRSLGPATREQKKRATTIAPALKCSRCHTRPARPHVGDADSENEGAKPVCERCSFSCLRCGEPALLHNNAKYVYCPQCRGLWRADVLGYRLLHMADWDDNENDTTNTDLDTEALLAMYASPRRKKKANQAASAKENPASPTKARKKERKEATLMEMNQKGWSKPPAKQVKKNMRETALEKARRKGHDYLVEAEGDDCVNEYYHGLWEDRPASPL
ncbi:hypothetical protein GTA08_BOTSDO07819 [Neofusicoccum parvum]|uniref:Uncharacterized protein n=1 Tax=Neofusicoccum parvum TaxID=310453 RepID=A0ACB5SH63_9PEZI|nr:hypothetical protein GTA08_BOTSDO07819 [Neofusicoccum parvum]